MRIIVPAVLLLSVFAGCRSSRFPADTELRLAVDTPDLFRFGESLGGGTCLSPAVDPTDGSELSLVRSDFGRGDYEIPIGRYGSRSGELLRISCSTGRALGLVPR